VARLPPSGRSYRSGGRSEDPHGAARREETPDFSLLGVFGE